MTLTNNTTNGIVWYASFQKTGFKSPIDCVQQEAIAMPNRCHTVPHIIQYIKGRRSSQSCYPVQVVSNVGDLGAVPSAVVPQCNTLIAYCPLGPRWWRGIIFIIFVQLGHQSGTQLPTSCYGKGKGTVTHRSSEGGLRNREILKFL